MKICVIGRDDRMGLGSMTADFCRGMPVDRLVIVEVGSRKGKIEMPQATLRVHRNSLSYEECRSLLEGFTHVVGFETWYFDDLPLVARVLGVKSVLFPMHEWSNDKQCRETDTLVCLSETDRLKYRDHPGCKVRSWPAMPEKTVAMHRWPPTRFVHVAGNAVHNREGTREVLLAASHLIGTEATLDVYASFNLRSAFPFSQDAPVRHVDPVRNRGHLYGPYDCLVQPRRLGGHSLPINEAAGVGLPTVVLDLPDWKDWPYRIPAWDQPRERFGPEFCEVKRADPDELGFLMREMACGRMEMKLPPPMPTWSRFADWWQKEVA